MSPKNNTPGLVFDLEKAIRLQKLVESGNFDIALTPAHSVKHRRKKDIQFRNSSKSSIVETNRAHLEKLSVKNDEKQSTTKLSASSQKDPSLIKEQIQSKYRDSKICQLLLSPGRVAAKAREGRSKVLTMQHKLVWSKNALNASRLFTTLHDDILHAILPNILLLYSEHLKPSIEDNKQNVASNDSVQTSPIAKRRFSKDNIEKFGEWKILGDLSETAKRNESMEKLFQEKILELAHNKKAEHLLNLQSQINDDKEVSINENHYDYCVKLEDNMQYNSNKRDEELEMCLEEIEKNLSKLREQEQELETKIPWLQQKSQLERSGQHFNPLKPNMNQLTKPTEEVKDKGSLHDCLKSGPWKEKLKRRLELSQLRTSPPSTPSESLISVGSDSSSSESSKPRSIIPDSILQLPVHSNSNLASKRASFDSGYISPRKVNITKSKREAEFNNIKVEEKLETPSNDSSISGDQVENDKNAPRKLSLDKSCPNCFKNRKEKRKMAVKFNFDEVDSTNGDAWVVFTCHFCKSQECEKGSIAEPKSPKQNEKDLCKTIHSQDKGTIDPNENDNESDKHDPIQEKFEMILQDITVYYSKKLDMLRIKSEQHQFTKTNPYQVELVRILLEVYEGSVNKDELWQDMFCRMSHGNASPDDAKRVSHWIDQETQTRIGIRACLADLRRERDKIAEAFEKIQQDRKKSKEKRQDFESLKRSQQQHCDRLHFILDDLYEERMVVWEEQERKKKEDEKMELEREMKKKIREKERREVDKEMIKRHRRNQNEIRGQNKFTLEKELRNKMTKRREKSLRDHIRVNLRKVMAEAKSMERKEAEKQAKMDEREKEARLESLRKQARRRLGLDIFKPQKPNLSQDDDYIITPETTALKSTVSSLARAKETEIQKSKVRRELHMKTPLFSVNTYTDDVILSDTRVVVENILREKGLLLSGSKSFARFFNAESQTSAGNMKCFDSASSYAAQRMLMDLPTPSKPRRDTSSAQVSAAISNGSSILKKRM